MSQFERQQDGTVTTTLSDYQLGVDETIKKFATGEFILGEEAEKFKQEVISEYRRELIDLINSK